MIRIGIRLTEEQAAAAKALAQREERSLGAVIREAVDDYLRMRAVADRADLKRRALAVPGLFRSGSTDVATAHDHHLTVDELMTARLRRPHGVAPVSLEDIERAIVEGAVGRGDV